jgi:KaiC/GvpD/RAD55 family RecA-like ATPase
MLVRAGGKVWGVSTQTTIPERLKQERFFCTKLIDDVKRARIMVIFAELKDWRNKNNLSELFATRAIDACEEQYNASLKLKC